MSEPLRTVRAMARPFRLAEEIRARGALMPNRHAVPATKEMFGGCVPVLLDQVCDWWNSATSVEEGEFTPTRGIDEPFNAQKLPGRRWPDDRLSAAGRLPWPKVWAEWSDTDQVQLEAAQRYGLDGRAMRFGVLLREIDAAIPGFHGCASAVLATCFTHIDGFPAFVMGNIGWGALEDGSPAKLADGDWRLFAPQGQPRQFQDGAWDCLGVWRLFTALLKVRGTEAIDTDVPRHVRRRWARLPDSSPPWITYKSLSIRLGSPDGSARGSATAGPPPGVPLHLVRGYIADYRRGNGLFGKYKQLVWVSSHLRGHARLGAVAKTYDASVHPEFAQDNGDGDFARISGGAR